jgi:hypothetical protein
MVWEPERLEQVITIRVQKDDLLKAQAVRQPEKLEEWKQKINEIENIPHLDNWYRKHWGEVKKSLPHEEDQAELLKYCGEHKQKLKAEYAKSINNPPLPEDEEPAQQAEVEEPEPIKLQLEFALFCTKGQAKKIGQDVYALIGENPMLQGYITLRKL